LVDFETIAIMGQGEPGQRHRVEGSLDNELWSPLGHVIALGGAFTIEQQFNFAEGGVRRFFRVQSAE